VFSLRKWYLDLVADDGEVVIAYAARLRWGRLRLRYASVLRSPPCGRAVDDFSFVEPWEPPRIEADAVTWRSESLGISGRWERLSAPIGRRLMAASGGAIEWACCAPSARATVRHGADTVRGIGYVESLLLTIPPWKLPFNELKWGRNASDRHAAVWIEWTGAHDARPTSAGLAGLAGNGEVMVQDARDVCRRSPLLHVSERLPPVVNRLNAMIEHKHVGRSAVVVGGRPIDTGWCVFEKVSW
jgi:hypothetical protein